MYLRNMDTLEATAISGTSGAVSSFFSPDGEWIGFFADGALKKVPIAGGLAQTLSEDGPGGSWASDDTIYFGRGTISALWKISASGGDPELVTTLRRENGEVSHRWPQVIAGGQALLFTVWAGPGSDERSIHIKSLQTNERHELVPGGDTGRYVASGHLVYGRLGADSLIAQPFDLNHIEVTGPPTELPDRIYGGVEGMQYAVSDTGLLAYVPGNPERFDRELVWVDRNGNLLEVLPNARPYTGDLMVSPDEQYAAVNVWGPTVGLGVYDFARNNLRLLTTDGSSQAPIWTPDGTRIAYRGTRNGFRNLFWVEADGSGVEQRLTTSENFQTPGSFSSDGAWLSFHEDHPTTRSDIWLLPLDLDGNSEPFQFLATEYRERQSRLSPDGRWLAYVSDSSGREEVYVQPFPDGGRIVQVSTAGGLEPIWSRNSDELFYRAGERRDQFMAVAIDPSQPTFAPSFPRPLFEGRYVPTPTGGRSFFPSQDGQRFLMVRATAPDPPTTQIILVQNWFEELNRLAPLNNHQ